MNATIDHSSVSGMTFLRFFRHIANGGYLLFFAAIVAVVWTNYSQETYRIF